MSAISNRVSWIAMAEELEKYAANSRLTMSQKTERIVRKRARRRGTGTKTNGWLHC